MSTMQALFGSQEVAAEIRKTEGDVQRLFALVETRKRDMVAELKTYDDLSVRVLVDGANVGRDLDASEARQKNLRHDLELAQTALAKVKANLLDMQDQVDQAKYEDALKRLPDLVAAGRVANREYADLVLQLAEQAQEIYRVTNELNALSLAVDRYTQQHPDAKRYGVRLPSSPFVVPRQMIDRASVRTGPAWVKAVFRSRPQLLGED